MQTCDRYFKRRPMFKRKMHVCMLVTSTNEKKQETNMSNHEFKNLFTALPTGPVGEKTQKHCLVKGHAKVQSTIVSLIYRKYRANDCH